ncbi:Retroviral-like aspartic protease 1 [Bienertia sinuspersici]
MAGQASTTTQKASIKQGGSLMVVNGEVNEVLTRILVDTGASHNFMARREAKALWVKLTKVDGEIKTLNSRATQVYGKAWDVPIRLGKWKGKVDFLIVDIDDEDVVWGSGIGIKLAQGMEQDMRSHP